MVGQLSRVFIFCLLSLTILLSGCGDDRPEQIEKYQQMTATRLNQLSSALDNGQVRNANLLKQYAQLLAQQNSQLTPLVNELALDATSQGPMFLSLKQRHNELSNAANFIDLDQQLAEAENLYQATDPSLFNDMLSDPVNVIADMSQGKLARVNSISREAALIANGEEDFGPGSQLVGNPSYGSWQTDSSGTSFWAWYGMYAMFSNIFNRPIYYDNWSNRRGYSYYNDVGRYRYTSPKQATAQNNTYQQTKKKFENQGKQFKSPYAKTRTGSTSLSRQSAAVPKSSTTTRTASSSSKFRSSYSKDSSFRNSTSRTTRGVSRGK